MKIKRFVALLAILLVSGLPTAGKTFKYHFGTDRKSKKVSTAEIAAIAMLAQALAAQVKQVHERFVANRNQLQILRGQGNARGYLPNEVTGLIVDTRKDLDQAIQSSQPSGTEPLRAWVDAEFQRIQEEIPPPGPTASLPGSSAPRAVAVFASSRGFGMPVFAKKPAKPAPAKPVPPQAPQPQTIPVARADRLLDQVGEVIRKIFVLANTNDLEVEIWVGSTPATKATFRFWPQGNLTGSTPSPTIIQTDGKRNHILRGLYAYRATWGKGAVTQFIEYPNPAGPTVAGTASERLDLVKGSRFFCCQFNEAYCHHVDDEKDCH